MLIEINAQYPEPRKLRRAVEAVERGAVIGYPTDAVYALGCDLFDKKAIDRLYQIKGMGHEQPLSFVCADLTDLSKYAIIDNHAYRLLRRVLPGPYTFILQATREVPKILHRSVRRTVGIRVPACAAAIELVRALGHPLISTTAQRHGEEPLVDPRDIEPTFKGVSMVLDGGLGGRQPTTIVDLSQGDIHVIREGAGPLAALR